VARVLSVPRTLTLTRLPRASGSCSNRCGNSTRSGPAAPVTGRGRCPPSAEIRARRGAARGARWPSPVECRRRRGADRLPRTPLEVFVDRTRSRSTPFHAAYPGRTRPARCARRVGFGCSSTAPRSRSSSMTARPSSRSGCIRPAVDQLQTSGRIARRFASRRSSRRGSDRTPRTRRAVDEPRERSWTTRALPCRERTAVVSVLDCSTDGLGAQVHGGGPARPCPGLRRRPLRVVEVVVRPPHAMTLAAAANGKPQVLDLGEGQDQRVAYRFSRY